MLPFRQVEIINYGPYMNRPALWPWVWEKEIPHFNFWFQTEGAGRLVCRGKEYRLEPGVCFLFTPGTEVRATNDPGAGMANFSVHFFPSPRQAISHEMLAPLFGRKVYRMNLFLELSVEMINSFKRGDELGRHQSEWGLLCMISHLWREAFNPPKTNQDEEILETLRRAAFRGECEAQVPDLARKVGLSPSQFTRRTQALTGDSPASYLIKERLNHARFLLIDSSKSVKMIAAELGYRDLSFFIRQFRKTTGLTPAAFRRQGGAGFR